MPNEPQTNQSIPNQPQSQSSSDDQFPTILNILDAHSSHYDDDPAMHVGFTESCVVPQNYVDPNRPIQYTHQSFVAAAEQRASNSIPTYFWSPNKHVPTRTTEMLARTRSWHEHCTKSLKVQ